MGLSFYEANARKLREAGLEYKHLRLASLPAPVVPRDAGLTSPYRDLTTGKELGQQSLWAPSTLRIYDEFYRRLATDFGESVDFIRLAMPSE